MYDIKIRVWDKKEKRMIYPDEAYKESRGMDYYTDILLMDMNRYISAYTDDDGGKEGLWEHSYDVDVVPMFYIGRNDKNRNMIFEGDIVDTRYGRFVVEYDKQLAGYYPFAMPNNAPDCETESEVIGNKFENPELKVRGLK